MNEDEKQEMLLNLEKIKTKDANQNIWIASFLKRKKVVKIRNNVCNTEP